MSEVPGTGEGPEGDDGYGPFRHKAGQPPMPEAGPARPASPVSGGSAGHPSDPAVPSSPAGTENVPGGYPAQSTPPAVDSWSMFPDGGPGSPSWQPRIVPSPKPSRRRMVVSGLLGLLAGLLAFGPTGFLVGYQTAPARSPQPSNTIGTALPPFERAQLNLNKPKFDGELATIAEPWLPYVTGCMKSSEKGAPALGDGEDAGVFCRYANVSVYFVKYKSVDARDKARTKTTAQNIDAKQMAPGVGNPTPKRATSGKADGTYIEYAFRSSADTTNRTICGVWWDDTRTPVAAYMLAYWSEGMGESWEPLRDVWRRYS